EPAGALHELRQPPPRPSPPAPGQPRLTAEQHYEQGFLLEESDPKGAMECYRRALAEDAQHADAHVNLGRLLHETGSAFDALEHYRAALASRPNDGTAAFNL